MIHTIPEETINLYKLELFNDVSLDHHIQLIIVRHMVEHKIPLHDLKYRYFDEHNNLVMENDVSLEHCRYIQNIVNAVNKS